MSNEKELEEIKRDVEMLKRAAEHLAEHFDTVQILATRHDPSKHEGTIRVNYGVGNQCARFGQAIEFVQRCQNSFVPPPV